MKTYVNFICNEDGMDPISFGATVAAAMELYEIGAIGTEQTGGIELKFGSAEALAWAAEAVATGEGSEVLGIPEKTDPAVTEGKAGLVKAFQDATAAVDSMGLCVFTTFAWTLDNMAPQMDAACEGDWTVDRLLEAGERIWNLERDYNMKAGLTAADDTLPERLLKEASKSAPTEGQVCRLEEMLPEYYSLRGWTADGTLTDEVRQKFSLPG